MPEERTEIHEGMLYAESIFGRNLRQGLVKLSHGISWEITITPSEARMYALSILEAADAAESDEFIVTWLKRTIGATEEACVAVLRDFREMRIDLRRRDLAAAKGEGGDVETH